MADVKIAYQGAWTDLTITLASLASDTNLLAGRESTAVDNSSNLFDDAMVSVKVTTGTSPTDARQIEVWVYTEILDDDTYADVFDGTDSNETVTSTNIKGVALHSAGVMQTGTTSDRTYFLDFSLVGVVGYMPRKWGVFVVHNTGVNLNATGGNHQVSYRGIYHTVV